MGTAESMPAKQQWPQWIAMLVVSFVSMLGLAAIIWVLVRLLRIDANVLVLPSFLLLLIGLGYRSPTGCWGSILGSTIGFTILNGVINAPEYGQIGNFYYTIGFLLIATCFILPAAGMGALINRIRAANDKSSTLQ